jgi:hypothetical protein
MIITPLLFLANHLHYLDLLNGREKLPYIYVQPVPEAAIVTAIVCLFFQASAADDANSTINSFMKNKFFTFWSKISYEHLFVHSFVHKFVEGHVPWVWLNLP